MKKNEEKNEKKLTMEEVREIFAEAKLIFEKRSLEIGEVAKRLGKNIFV